jgi:hypothetical protein
VVRTAFETKITARRAGSLRAVSLFGFGLMKKTGSESISQNELGMHHIAQEHGTV